MNHDWWSDDDQLLAMLKEAVRAGEVPREVVEAGKAVYAQHDLDLDAELAALTYDSYLEEAVGVRAEPAALRALTYTTAQLTIELEITVDALKGQLVPARAGSATARSEAGGMAVAPIDEMGYFVFRPVPEGPFRVRCVTESGVDVSTGLITP